MQKSCLMHIISMSKFDRFLPSGIQLSNYQLCIIYWYSMLYLFCIDSGTPGSSDIHVKEWTQTCEEFLSWIWS